MNAERPRRVIVRRDMRGLQLDQGIAHDQHGLGRIAALNRFRDFVGIGELCLFTRPQCGRSVGARQRWSIDRPAGARASDHYHGEEPDFFHSFLHASLFNLSAGKPRYERTGTCVTAPV
jgi:hypothetical protein